MRRVALLTAFDCARTMLVERDIGARGLDGGVN